VNRRDLIDEFAFFDCGELEIDNYKLPKMIINRKLVKSCGACPECDVNKKVRLYKSNNGYELDLDHKHVERFPLTIKGYYDALRLFKETLEFEASEALK
jgi:hypothetical protein